MFLGFSPFAWCATNIKNTSCKIQKRIERKKEKEKNEQIINFTNCSSIF